MKRSNQMAKRGIPSIKGPGEILRPRKRTGWDVYEPVRRAALIAAGKPCVRDWRVGEPLIVAHHIKPPWLRARARYGLRAKSFTPKRAAGGGA